MKIATRPSFSDDGLLSALGAFERPLDSSIAISAAMQTLQVDGWWDLPEPGSAGTLERWRALSAVAAFDLPLAKIYESHTDAVAILHELDCPVQEGLYAVWAAEAPSHQLIFENGRLQGRKAWCSGAAIADRGLVTARQPDGTSRLLDVSMHQPNILLNLHGWQAVGMKATGSAEITFDQAEAQLVGEPGEYLTRPGFWQGGAGIAAVWFGGARAVAATLARSSRVQGDPHAAAHLGAVDTSLRAARSLLLETAQWIAEHPCSDASGPALRVRCAVEQAANDVLLHSGRALGPAPLCADRIHAQRVADLEVFLRQSHAEHDLAALGRAITANTLWTL